MKEDCGENRVYWVQFQSYLYGIEITVSTTSISLGSCFNRTFMELKYVKVMLILNLYLCFNRTFMELKFLYKGESGVYRQFQSYLYGIEMTDELDF